MKRIKLTQGQFAIVDDDDFDRVSQFTWHAQRTKSGDYYARHAKYLGGGRQNPIIKFIPMHRFVSGFIRVDHKNGNKLDNRKENLRSATQEQNRQAFRLKSKNVSSKYRGVCWDRNNSKWRATICRSGKCHHLGFFLEEKKAAEAYNSFAFKFFGEFAHLNDIS
jgi:hypothetical protein